MNYQLVPQGKDPQLWQLAQRRASFKRHLATYLVVNILLWLIWVFSGSKTYDNSLPWPAWASLGWGIGVLFHFISAYVSNGQNSVEKEYDKLSQNQNKQ